MPVTAAVLAVSADPLGLLVAFGAGMLSFLSPCVLPLVPGYISMVSGLTAAELSAMGEHDRERVPAAVAAAGTGPPPGSGDETEVTTAEQLRVERGRVLRGILWFIAGFTVVFVVLGAAASAVGRLLLTHQLVLETVSGAVVVAFGLVLVGMALGVRLPVVVVGERRFAVRPSALGAWAPPVMGMAFAFGWTPCIGPVLGSVLALAAARSTLVGGVALLLAYSLGLGVPFLLCGLAFGRMTDGIARVRGRLRAVDLVGGTVLVVFGVLLLTHNLDWVSAQCQRLLQELHLGRLATS